MKKHPEYGWAVLRLLPGLERASLFVLHHHENLNGKGYPAGLKEVEIPIGARIVSVIDTFDAMVSSRPYRQGMSREEAIRRLILSAKRNPTLPWFSASFTSPRRRCRPFSPPRALPSPAHARSAPVLPCDLELTPQEAACML